MSHRQNTVYLKYFQFYGLNKLSRINFAVELSFDPLKNISIQFSIFYWSYYYIIASIIYDIPHFLGVFYNKRNIVKTQDMFNVTYSCRYIISDEIYYLILFLFIIL